MTTNNAPIITRRRGLRQPGELLVELTATSNPYLAPRLPLEGYLKVGEVDLDGRVRWATFVAVDADGGPVGTRVEIRDAAFTVGRVAAP